MKNIICYTPSVIFLTFLFVLPLHAGAGKSGSNQLKVDAGARSVAMGGVQFGSEGSAFAMHYNPAFITGMSQQEIGFMHNEYLLDLRQEVAEYIRPTEKRGVFGGGINYFTYGTINGYNATGGKTGDLSAYDMVLHGSWGRVWSFEVGNKVVEDFSGGATLKIINKKLGDDTAYGFAVDLGFAVPVKIKYLEGIKIAGAIQNLSNGIKFDSDTSELPRVSRLGASYGLWGEAVVIGVDGVMASGRNLYPSVGIEYKILKMAAVRAGYKGDNKLEKNFTYGVGFENPLFNLDYAFVPLGDLGDTHRVSVGYRFGKNYKKPRADTQLQEKVKEAKTLYGQGLLVDAYLISMQINHVAPWMDENKKLLASIQKSFRELEESDKKEKLLIQISALFSRGERFFEEGNLINARQDFQAVIGLQPDHAAAQGYLKQIEGQFQSFVENFYKEGLVAFAAEDYEKAREAFDKVVVIKPDHEDAKAQLAKCIEILESRAKEQVQVLQKQESVKVFKEGLAAYRDEKYEESISRFTEVLGLDPENGEAKRYIASAHEILYKRYLGKGQDYAAKGEWENAVKTLKMSLEHNPRASDARSSLENVQRRWELQRKVVSQNLYKEGLESFLSGDKKKAKNLWQKSLESDPTNEEAKRGLERLGQ